MTIIELESRKAAAMAAYRRATVLAADGDEEALRQKPVLWGELKEVEQALSDDAIIRNARAQREREEASRVDRETVQAAIARGVSAVEARTAIAARIAGQVAALGETVREWDTATRLIAGCLVHATEGEQRRLASLLFSPEAVVAGLLGRAIPGLSTEDMGFQAHAWSNVDFPQAMAKNGEHVAALLRAQLNDEPLEAA